MTFALALQSWSPLDNESITQLYIIQLSMRPARWKSLILHQLSISDTIQTFLIVVIVDCINLTSILVCCWFCHQSKPANLSLSKQSSGTPLLTNHLAFCHGKCIAQESGTRLLCQNIGFVCVFCSPSILSTILTMKAFYNSISDPDPSFFQTCSCSTPALPPTIFGPGVTND